MSFSEKSRPLPAADPSRRGFLASAGATLLLPAAAKADHACYQPTGWGQPCEVGIPIGQLVPAQECPNWCWAACLETIFLLAGYEVGQEVFAERVFGGPGACNVATAEQIAYAANGDWIDSGGYRFRAWLDVVMDTDWGVWTPDPVGLAWEELYSGRPLIVGSLGHAVLMTAMSYTEYSDGSWDLTGITVRDPWPEGPQRRRMSPQEFHAMNFLATVRVG